MNTLFDWFLFLKKATHSIKVRMLGGHTVYARNYSWATSSIPKNLPKIIWLYWDSPLDHGPALVQAAVRSWIELNPSWDVRVLSSDTVHNYISIPSTKHPRKIQWQADLIRIALLEKFGGVWSDATSICNRPLDSWLPPLMQSGFFAFPDYYRGRIMENWFIAAAPDNYLVRKWLEGTRRYYLRDGEIDDYFWAMHMFEFVVRTDRKARDVWDFTPKLSSKGPLLLKRILTEQKFAEKLPVSVDLSAIPLLKLSAGIKANRLWWLETLDVDQKVDLRDIAEHLGSRTGD